MYSHGASNLSDVFLTNKEIDTEAPCCKLGLHVLKAEREKGMTQRWIMQRAHWEVATFNRPMELEAHETHRDALKPLLVANLTLQKRYV